MLADAGSPPARPLIVTGNAQLLDDLLRLAAAAGVEPEVATEPALARAAWATAPLVLVGADLAVAAGQTLPRRPDGVVLVGVDLDNAQIWEDAVDVGAQKVVFLPDAEDWLVGEIADAIEGARRHTPVVAVLGGRGGAGATTLAAALAVTAVRHRACAWLIDGDPLGGGIDLVVGGEDTRGLRWPDLAGSRGRVSAQALRDALPTVAEGLIVLSWDRSDRLVIPASAIQSVLHGARRGGDLVVVDLPRRIDEAAEHVLGESDLALMVVPAEVRAAAAASRVAAAVAPLVHDLRLVVRGPAPTGLPATVIAETLGLPLLGSMRPEPGLPEAADRGEPPARSGRGPLAELCGRLLRELQVGRRLAA